jgi:hypothetical protein
VARLRHQSHPTYAFYPFYRARAELVGAGVGTIDGRLSLKTWPDDATIGVIVNGRPVPTGGGN